MTLPITIKALSPIAHGAFKDGVDSGNISEFRRVPVFRAENNKICEIPAISGNAIRGTIRRLLAREYFAVNALSEKLTVKEHDRLYAIMANGGALGKDLDASVDPEKIRKIREKLPVLSVIGGACYKYILSGSCSVGFAMLSCSELGTGTVSADELVAEIGETRHVDKTVINTEEQALKPMPYVTEAVIAGAEFTGEISFSPQATAVEIAAICHGIKLINHLGGKSARGYGKVEIRSENEIDDSAYLEVYDKADIEFIKSFIEGT